jgi:hypothetical protein
VGLDLQFRAKPSNSLNSHVKVAKLTKKHIRFSHLDFKKENTWLHSLIDSTKSSSVQGLTGSQNIHSNEQWTRDQNELNVTHRARAVKRTSLPPFFNSVHEAIRVTGANASVNLHCHPPFATVFDLEASTRWAVSASPKSIPVST